MRVRYRFAVLAALVQSAEAKDISLSAEHLKNLAVETVEIRAVSEHPLATLPALIGPARDSRIAVVTPFSGTVTDVTVLEGHRVERGARLGAVFSRDLLGVQSQLAQVQAALSAATAAAQRARLLADEGVIAGARAEEAEARASALRAQFDEQSHLVSVAQIDRNRAGTYMLTAPVAGHIARVDIEPGMAVDAMASSVIIDKSDKLWLEAQLPADLIGKVQPGATALVGTARGRVVASGMTVDPMTRSAVLYAEFPASSGLISGRAVDMTLLAKTPRASFSVPSAAIVRVGAKDTVFVATPTGFQAVTIDVLGKNSETAAITGPLTSGQRVAVAGLSELKVLAEQD